MEKIEKTMEAVRKNNMCAYYAERKEDVINIIESITKDGDTVAVGGSMSLFECGVIDFLRSGRYNFIDRYKQGLSQKQIRDIFLSSFSADVYLASTNAITENGELYNVDGNGNRVAAMLYGPESVILVVGKNKIVKDIDEAAMRVKKIAAPKNSKRLDCHTYCQLKDGCMSVLKNESYICDGCESENRICCDYTIISKQRNKNRIKIIFVNEDLGY